jgi:5'-3' exonuclease
MTIESGERERLLLVDSMALLFRGFFATAATGNYMRTPSGVCTNGVHQFVRYFLDAYRTVRPAQTICAFDMGKTTFRNELYPAYKANRTDPPEELLPQFELLRKTIACFDVPVSGIEGYEADDILGTWAKNASAAGYHVYILTGDGDTLQLVDQYVTVMMMKKGIGNYDLYDLPALKEKKNVRHPSQIVELKALMGDASDNIPGCPGIGPKTAAQLIDQFHSIDELYARIDEVKGKRRERLIEHRDAVYLSRDLATIRTDVDIDCSLDGEQKRFTEIDIRARLKELELERIAALLEKEQINVST